MYYISSSIDSYINISSTTLYNLTCYPFEFMSRYHDTQLNPYPAELIDLNFQPLEVVSRYRDPQPQVAENY